MTTARERLGWRKRSERIEIFNGQTPEYNPALAFLGLMNSSHSGDEAAIASYLREFGKNYMSAGAAMLCLATAQRSEIPMPVFFASLRDQWAATPTLRNVAARRFLLDLKNASMSSTVLSGSSKEAFKMTVRNAGMPLLPHIAALADVTNKVFAEVAVTEHKTLDEMIAEMHRSIVRTGA